VVADGKVLVVGEEGLVGAEELADSGGVVDRGVEVGVVGDVDGFDQRGSGDGVEGGFGLFSVRRGCREEVGHGVAEERPGLGAEGHQGVEHRGLAGSLEGGREKIGFGAGVEVEEVGSDGNAEVLPVFDLEGSVGEVGEGEVGRRVVRAREPASRHGDGRLCHAA